MKKSARTIPNATQMAGEMFSLLHTMESRRNMGVSEPMLQVALDLYIIEADRLANELWDKVEQAAENALAFDRAYDGTISLTLNERVRCLNIFAASNNFEAIVNRYNLSEKE